MKKPKVLLSIILTLSILAVSILPTLAENVTALNESTDASWKSKIDEGLRKELEKVVDGEYITVWAWFTDIDKYKAESKIERLTGVIRSEYKTIKDTTDVSLGNKKKEYLNANSKLNNAYQRTRVNVYSDLYSKHNTYILNVLDIPKENIIYQCDITPSAIFEIPTKRIKELAQSKYITKMYYYDESELEEEVLNEEKIDRSISQDHLYDMDSLHFNDVINEYNYTGTGVNILVIGGMGYAEYNENIINPSNVFNLVGTQLICITDISHQPEDINQHTTHVVQTLKQYAPSCAICVSKPFEYAAIRSAILMRQIDIICVAFGYGRIPSQYDPVSKWFDIISSTYDRTIVASIGTDYNGSNSRVTVPPAKGYNSIAVGAYPAKYNMYEEKMDDSRYTPAEYMSISSYKPDVVLPTYDSSSASPTLAGIIACAIQANRELRCKPEAQKAVVMASCHRKAKPYSENELQETMENGLTLKQGVGVVDAYRIIRIAREGTFNTYTLSANHIPFVTELLPSEDVDYGGTIKYNDKINVSLVWQVNGVLGIDPDTEDTTVNSVQELSLSILDGNNTLNSSKLNSCKQMVYNPNGIANTTYAIQVNNITNNNITSIYFAYAWSEKSAKELSSLSISGNVAVGQSLYANVIDGDNTSLESRNNYTVHWKRSIDGFVWSSDIGNDDYYQLTDSDLNCYIECEVKPQDCSLYAPTILQSSSLTRVVKYGDVNLNGSVTNEDVLLLQYYLAEITSLNDEQMIAADVDLDGTITALDSTIILEYLQGMISSLPYTN